MRRVLVGIGLTLLLTVPAGASEQDPHVTDPCGDAGALVWAGGDSVDDPDGRSDGFDIKAVWFSDIEAGGETTGVRVVLELCGDVPEPRVFGTSWHVGWMLEDKNDADGSCEGSVQVNDVNTSDGLERTARFSKACMEPYEDILGRQGSQGYSVFDLGLSSFAVHGPRITWELPRDAFDGEAAEILAPGTTWERPRAQTSDTGGSLFWMSVGTAGVQGGATDRTAFGRDFVVGD